MRHVSGRMVGDPPEWASLCRNRVDVALTFWPSVEDTHN
jgi:hypothetical protein